MQTSVLRSAAMVISAVLAGSAITGISPAAAESTTCVATELKLPAGTPTDVHSDLIASDPTARYQVGTIQLSTPGDDEAVFWTDGVPQVLQQDPARRTFLMDVNSKGTVLGGTELADGQSQPWLYSKGAYRKLKLPVGMEWITPRALNERGDVVGTGSDKVTGRSSAIVWPAGGTPRRLLADDSTYGVDINGAGVVVGSLITEQGETGMIWKRWDSKGVSVKGNGASAGLTAISGNYITGIQTLNDGSVIGGLWTTRSSKVVDFPNILDGVNTSGDVAYLDATGQTVVARRDGTQYAIDAEGYNTVTNLFERGQAYDAAGTREYGWARPVLWSGCSN